MKNKIFNLLLIAAFTVFTYSCEDFLSVSPHDSLNSDNAVETVEDFNNVTRSIYQQMRAGSYSEVMTILPDVMSDNLLICSDGRQTWSEYYQFEFSSTTSGTAGFWLYSYSAILSANEVITRLEGDGAPFKDDKTAQSLLAEALALRAYLHFNLVRFYGKAYGTATDADLGVPYKTSTLASEKPARETVKEVYAKILADLTKAKTIFAKNPDHNADANNRLNAKSVSAILAKVYFNMGDYANAAKEAAASLKKDGSDVVKLDDYTKIWTTSMDAPEVLFRLSVLQTDAQIPGNVYGQGEITNHKPEYVVAYSFFTLFDADIDIRASNIKEVTLSGKQYNAIWKYRGRTGENTGKIDIPLIRTSEMYLTLAESLIRKSPSDLAGARTNLDYVRNNRYSKDDVPVVKDDELLEAIAKERRLELAFEGDRFFEIKRLNLDIERDEFGDQADGTGVPGSVLKIAKTSPYFLLAIPQDEINANDNMIQNIYKN